MIASSTCMLNEVIKCLKMCIGKQTQYSCLRHIGKIVVYYCVIEKSINSFEILKYAVWKLVLIEIISVN